jgi:DNA repair ATPase RecN
MIQESYIQAAIAIRRKYLSLITNVEIYHNNAKRIISTLEESIIELNDIKENKQDVESISSVLGVLSKVDDETQRLEKIMEPINIEIENLSKEENELFRLIKDKYTTLSHEDIYNYIQERLVNEGLA